jgi:hypothetical protein
VGGALINVAKGAEEARRFHDAEPPQAG